VNRVPNVTYTPSTMFGFGDYELSSYLTHLPGGSFVMNCTDCADAVTTLSNLLGCNLAEGQFFNMVTKRFLTLAGNPASNADWVSWSWGYHEICRLGAIGQNGQLRRRLQLDMDDNYGDRARRPASGEDDIRDHRSVPSSTVSSRAEPALENVPGTGRWTRGPHAEPARQSARAEEILRQIPRGESDLFRGASAWAADVPDWRRSVREQLVEAPSLLLRRTVWDDPGSEARILIDVVECGSAAEAVRALFDKLEWNQLAELPAGPQELGVASFTHPEGVSPAVFFARANLCVSVVSFAQRAAAVLPVATALDRRLMAEPAVGGPPLRVEAERGARVGPAVLRVIVPFPLAEEGHLRYRARGGTLEIRDNQVVVIPVADAEVQVDVFAEEAGRAAGSGRVVIPQ
jgi:hypothetical protein